MMKEISEANLVFVGDIGSAGQSSYQRMDTLRGLGANIRSMDVTLPAASFFRRNVLPRIFNLAADPRTVAMIDQRMGSLAEEPPPDVAWFEWPRMVSRKTLELLRSAWPKTTFVCFQDDNPFGSRRGHQCLWRRFVDNIPFYDLHFVKRPSDLANFQRAGARRAAICTTGYYEPIFEFESPADPQKDVLFVGTAMDHRVKFLENLVMKRGLPIDLHGGRWHRSRIPRERLSPAIYGADYAAAIRDHKISLGFVSSSNHDEYTMRSLEIPAAGGFLLAERTPFHQKLFREGVEAEFFSSVDECAEKIHYYLGHDEERKRIAENGSRRCREGGYGWSHRLRQAWTELSV